jgi:ATPase family associated with various cellular activities (AAA)
MSTSGETAIIITGPAGCGKSYWIHNYARERGRQLFVCPCRKDRTLRDGRQKLHIWGRRTEPAILWLEGADDLTPEAQAFLRRILETHAPQVQFILECRDSSRLQEPIRSRCTIHRHSAPTWEQLIKVNSDVRSVNFDEIKEYLQPYEYSFRRMKHCIDLQLFMPEVWKIVVLNRKDELSITTIESDKIPEYIAKSYNPETLLFKQLQETNDTKKQLDYGECLDNAGSLWAFLGYVA